MTIHCLVTGKRNRNADCRGVRLFDTLRIHLALFDESPIAVFAFIHSIVGTLHGIGFASVRRFFTGSHGYFTVGRCVGLFRAGIFILALFLDFPVALNAFHDIVVITSHIAVIAFLRGTGDAFRVIGDAIGRCIVHDTGCFVTTCFIECP